MSAEHPTPWRLGNFKNLEGELEYDNDTPILDANGNAVVVTDSGYYPPDRETAEEIIAAVNAFAVAEKGAQP